LTTGGFNFDAKLRRQSVSPDDLFHAHIGGVDALARGLVSAAALLENGGIEQFTEQRYAGWREADADAILTGQRSLADVANAALARNHEPNPRSGRQEMLENQLRRFL
jgi:xylose isomerase